MREEDLPILQKVAKLKLRKVNLIRKGMMFQKKLPKRLIKHHKIVVDKLRGMQLIQRCKVLLDVIKVKSLPGSQQSRPNHNQQVEKRSQDHPESSRVAKCL